MKWNDVISSSHHLAAHFQSHMQTALSCFQSQWQFRVHFSDLPPLWLLHLNWGKLSQMFCIQSHSLSEPLIDCIVQGHSSLWGEWREDVNRQNFEQSWAYEGVVGYPAEHIFSLFLPLLFPQSEYLRHCLCQPIPSASLCALEHTKQRTQALRLVVVGRLVLYKTFTSGHWLHIKYSKLLSLH